MSTKLAKTGKKSGRTHQDTTVNISPLTVDEALTALLKTPPPGKAGLRKTGTTVKAGNRSKGRKGSSQDG